MKSSKMKVTFISAIITAIIAVLITIYMDHSILRAILIGLAILIVSIITKNLFNKNAQNTNKNN
ncbi:hypothetical protein [Bacillus sp. 1P02SD]|uniref:hypothetical protein n=1 Tax=Bacillus sp. 1P02SD TaxID=3132264 RepID=UPI0039A10C50